MINDILDIGCSVGTSTRYLVDKFEISMSSCGRTLKFCTGFLTTSSRNQQKWKKGKKKEEQNNGMKSNNQVQSLEQI